MSIRFTVSVLLLLHLVASCTEEYDCIDTQIQPAFINYSPLDIDTLILRRFKENDNYRTLIDTFVVRYGSNSYYETFNDTTSVLVSDGKNGIKSGFDWQLFVPVKRKSVLISDIVSERKTGKRGYGIFSLGVGTDCVNNIYSAKINNKFVDFSKSRTERYCIFIIN